jgi:exodeoxyribonuclease VII large subunit
MSQMSLFQKPTAPTYSVEEVTAHLRSLLEADELLQNVWIKGEISNLSQPKSGHLYFTIKDRFASLRCVMWKNMVGLLPEIPKNGDAIEVHGNISVYEASGQYQLYVDQIRGGGEGALYLAFLALKNKLEKEGLFNPENKKQLPQFPKAIGIVTSPTGAALRDMLNTLRRRYPFTRVVLSPAAVQGINSPKEIDKAIQKLFSIADVEVIIIARGGGSIEDLAAFNDEAIARTIAASPIPVISGVGHETDFTIADFVADARAATPTAAAEIASPNITDLLDILNNYEKHLGSSLLQIIQNSKWNWQNLHFQLVSLSPMHKIQSQKQLIDDLLTQAKQSLTHQTSLYRSVLSGTQKNLAGLNPESILKRGYALVSNNAGEIVTNTNHLATEDNINVQFAKGKLTAKVTKINSLS